jgi:hypothetical protein
MSGSDEPHWGQKPIHLADRWPQVSQLNAISDTFTGLTIAPLNDEYQGSHECRAKDCGGQDRGDRPGLMGSDRPQKHPMAQ